MKYQVYFGIAIRIIILFSVGMLWTLINPQLRNFFEDVPCTSTYRNSVGVLIYNCGGSVVDEQWSWGVRHYWYFWMMFLLFILSLVNVVIGIVKTVTKHYPEL